MNYLFRHGGEFFIINFRNGTSVQAVDGSGTMRATMERLRAEGLLVKLADSDTAAWGRLTIRETAQ